MEDLLRRILIELQEMNGHLDTIAGAMPLVNPIYNLDDIHSKIEEVGDQITGGIGGVGGKDLSDVSHRIEMLEISVS
jgi:hypothetical protein